MITLHHTLAVALLAVGLHTQLGAAPEAAPNPNQTRLSAARKAALDQPEVAAAGQQAKADRALSTKAYAEYKMARKRSSDSETLYREAFDAALAKVDEGAPALQEKERAAFRERMLKARAAKKKEPVKVAAVVEDDEEDPAEEPAARENAAN